MAGTEEYRQAAKTLPKDRTSAQQALVSDAHSSGMTDIKNLDHEAQQTQRFGR